MTAAARRIFVITETVTEQNRVHADENFRELDREGVPLEFPLI